MIEEDALLLKRTARGDTRAFRMLVERYQNAIYGFFLRSTGNPEDAEDLTQQLFINLYRAAPRYRPTASFRTFIYRIATNLAVSFSRSKHRRDRVVSLDRMAEEGYEPASAAPGENPEETTRHVELEQAYIEALMRLPADWRVALELRVGRNLPYREIAEVMGKSVSAVESILFRARERLATDLQDFREDSDT